MSKRKSQSKIASKTRRMLKAPSPDEIEAAKTENGGWTRATLASWGVRWPPPPGWRARLEDRYERLRPET